MSNNVTLIFLSSTIVSQAALNFIGPTTDGSGVDSVSGAGGFVANVNPSFSSTQYDETVSIMGISASPTGTQVNYTSALIADNHGSSFDYSGARLAAPIEATLGLTAVGTGTVDVYTRKGFFGTDQSWGGFGVRVTSAGVTELDFTIDYSDDVFSRGTGAGSGSFAGIVGALANQADQWAMEYQLFDPSGAAVDLSSPLFLQLNSGQLGLPATDNTAVSWNATDERSEAIFTGDTSFGVNDFADMDGSANDVIRSIRVVVRPAGGATEFTPGTQFNFSVDGQNMIIPEPSSSFLLGLCSILLLHRKRKN